MCDAGHDPPIMEESITSVNQREQEDLENQGEY